MCGILALLGVNAPETAARRALDEMAHRGPDACGSWSGDGVWLGCRRLAVVDPASRSDQPVIDETTGVAVVFNGEIYNYRDIRRDLMSYKHQFGSDSDTEVLLRAYLQWGPGCLSRLNGMWAFVLWDARTRTVFYARDRLGVKPLYYARVGFGVAFASEPKALIALDPALRVTNYRALARLLVAKQSHSDGDTFYSHISAIEPGSYGVSELGAQAISTSRFWNACGDTSPCRTSGSVTEEFGEIFEHAVRLRLDCDQKMALALSGGLDSTAILTASRAAIGRGLVRGYTSTYEHFGVGDDREWAGRAAQRADLALSAVPAPSDEWVDTLRRIVWHMDGPGYTPAVYPLWKLMETARIDGIKVMLEGQGADELLGGYPRHVAAALIDALGALSSTADPTSIARCWNVLRAGGAACGWPRLGQDLAIESWAAVRSQHQLLTTVMPALDRDFAALATASKGRIPCSGGRLQSALCRDLTSGSLPGFLHYGDAISMAHGIETRHPFLDVNLVEYCLRLDPAHKIGVAGTKAPIREYLAAGGQPEIARRGVKRGYPTPINDWMSRRHGALLRDILLDPAAHVASFTIAHRLDRLITRLARGHSALAESLYSLLATELWLDSA